jgi:type VI secretion system protein ImpL
MISPSWLLILLVIVLLLLGTALFLYVILKRARKISFATDPNAKAESQKKKSPPLEFLQYASDIELRSSFRRALRILKTHVTGRDFRYQVPWYLMAGEADSGKTTLLDSTGISLAVTELAREDRQLNWFFFNEALVIDAAGDFVLREDGTANHRGWNTISRLLQKHRPQRPLDGLVLTIPVTDLLDGNDLSHDHRNRLEEKALSLYQKLWQVQKILGMRLPVYILVTKCDDITGFASFSNQLPDRLKTQMLGWSNPCTLDTAYNSDLLPEAFDSLHRYISRLQFEIYTERDQIENADDLFLFPAAIQSMRAPFQVYLDCLFKESAYHESYFFRGIYFCGEGLTEPSLDLALAAAVPAGWTDPIAHSQAPLPKEIVVRERKPIFLFDLFKEKIFREASLAQPIRSTLLSRNRMALAAQALSLAIVIIGGLGLALSYRGLAHREAVLYEVLANEKTDLEKVETSQLNSYRQPAVISRSQAADRASDTTLVEFNHPPGRSNQPATLVGVSDAQGIYVNQPTLRNGEARLLSGMAQMNGKKFYSVFMPTSWFSRINERIENSLTAAFPHVVFQPLRSDLEQREQKLLNVTAEYSPRLNTGISERQVEQLPRYDLIDQPDPLDQSFQLHLYVEELGDLRLNLERYDRLIKKDSSAFDDLLQLINYLGHAPVPANFDHENELFKRALKTAEGRPIETAPFYKESADRIAEIVEDMYEGSFNRRGVKYDHLNDLAETEALLTRPEYTWLSSYVSPLPCDCCSKV